MAIRFEGAGSAAPLLVAVAVALASLALVRQWLLRAPSVASGDPMASNRSLDGIPQWPGARQALLNSSCPQTEHFALLALHNRLDSPIVRTGPNQVHIADPASQKVVFAQGTRFEKAPLYDLYNAEPGKANLFTSRNREEHGQRRRLMAHAFATSSLADFAPFVRNRIGALVDILRGSAQAGRAVDVFTVYQNFTGDIVSKFAFGRDDHMVETGLLNPLLAGIRTRTGSRMSSLLVYQLLQRIPLARHLVFLLPSRLMREEVRAIASLNVLMLGYVDDFIANNEDQTEILHKLLAARDPLTGAKLDRATLMGESRGLVVAGVETTAAALTYMTYHLAKSPALFQRLAAELHEVVPDLDSFLDGVVESIPDERLIVRLPFLDALLKEVYRCYPAGVRPFPRTVPPQGVHLDGYFLPGGIEVTCSSWVQGRWDKSIWADDPEVFRPERWLCAREGDGKRYQDMSSAITTFSAGPRGCIGRNLATMVLHLTCFTVFRCLQPGASEEVGQGKTILTSDEDMAFVGTFVGNPKGHRLDLLFAATKA